MRVLFMMVACALVLAPRKSEACVALGASGPIPIRGEEALIVWDEAHKTEHFIRRAFFKDAPADFGFLVPTPTRPTLNEVPAIVFDRLYELYKMPETAHATNSRGPIAAAATPPVQVIAEQKVAGLDATILLATDGKALQTWLAAHKYPSSPALEHWLAPYIKSGAYITAFKLAGGAQTIDSTAVRMSFATTAPMFPYSEPASDGTRRPFRLTVVSKSRVEGRLGDKAWNASVGYANFLSQDRVRALLDGVVPTDAQQAAFVTVFDEPRSLRGSRDLLLRAAPRDERVGPSLTTKIAP
jgi:Uncharacterized protein conserved in bacteria (DUF2330)